MINIIESHLWSPTEQLNETPAYHCVGQRDDETNESTLRNAESWFFMERMDVRIFTVG